MLQFNSAKRKSVIATRLSSALIASAFLMLGLNAQTTLISPGGDGGFETGAGFAANGWTVLNGAAVNTWNVGTVPTLFGTGRSAFVSNDGGVSHAYSISPQASASLVHFYRDVTFPAGETAINLSFQWYGQGESTFDFLQVAIAPTSVTPVVATNFTGGVTPFTQPITAGSTTLFAGNLAGTLQSASVAIPAAVAGNCAAASTMRLIFTWRSDNSLGTQPPGAIDNISLVSQTPILTSAGGTFTINNTLPTGGTNFNSFTAAINALNGANCAPLSGPVIFNVTSGQTFVEATPMITASGSLANPIVFQKTAGTNPLIQQTGTSALLDAVITIHGGDFITFDGIDVGRTSGTDVEFGFLLRNSSVADGAQNNTIQNTTISLDRANTNSRGIFQTTTTTGGGITPTASSGANSNNIYRNLTIRNVYSGINLNGTAAFPDVNCQVTTTACGIFNVIGDPGTPADIGGGNAATTAFGINALNQSGFTISNNAITNVSNTTAQLDGINILTFVGTCTVSNNIIKSLRRNSTTSTTVLAGIRATHTTTGSNTLRLYNNAISDITTAYTGAATATRAIKGIFLASTGGNSSQSYEVWSNTVSIDGSGSANISSVCLESTNSISGPVLTVRNNILANYTATQTGVARHFAMVHTTSATQVANAGTVVSNNDLYVPNGVGVTGFTALGSSTNYNGPTAWATGVTSGQVSNNIDNNPLLVDPVANLIPQAAEVSGTGAMPPPYITIDLLCNGRGATMGAYEVAPPSCFPPTGTVAYVQDCGSGQFFLDVTVTNLSGGPGVDVVSNYTGNPGADFSVGLGTFQIGPFPSNTNVVVSLLRNGDPTCDVSLGTYNFDCTTIGQNALSFDGVDDRVNCGTGPSVNITGTQITLEAWIYATAWRSLIYEGNVINKEGGNVGYMLRAAANGTLNFAIGSGTGFSEINSPAGSMNLNTWYHIAGTYDGVTQRAFINGVQVASAAVSTTIATTANQLVIGDWSVGTGRNFPGKIDEVRIWGVALNALTIANNMNTLMCGTETGLRAYYRFDQGVDGGNNAGVTTLTDLTANANTGTLSGFALSGPSSNWVLGKTGLGACVPPSCVAPTAAVTYVPNCAAGTFNLSVNVSNLGDAANVDISTNPGAVLWQDNVGTGVYILGPFPVASSQTVTIAHNGNASCNQAFGPYTGVGVICNDDCANAIPVPCNSSIAGTTIGSNANDAPAGTCSGFAFNTSGGVWYTVTGTGLPITASLCGGATWDTKLAVYTGACGALTCLVGDDDTCDPGTQSVVTWTSTLGTTYHVYVTGFSTNTGVFTLTVSCATCLAPTATATIIPDCANGQFSISVNLTGMGNATSIGLESTLFGVEQTVTSTGTYVMGPYPQASTQTIFLRHNVNATCDVNLGTFSGANVLCNDDCTGAFPIICGQTVTGTNTGATDDGLPSQCAGGEATINNGVWWKFLGDDSFVTLNLCASGFDTRVHVFQGACGSLVGVNGNDDAGTACSLGTRSIVTFNAVIGTTYYIAVEGFGTANGAISMTATCGPLCTPFVANDACGAAEIITVGTTCVPTGGNLVCAAATPGANPCGLAIFSTFPDAWYQFTATAPNIFVNLTYGTPGMQFVVYNAGSCSPLPATFFCSGATTSGAPTLVSGLTTGNSYLIRVLTLQANACPFTICVQNLEVSDNPCAPIPITCGGVRFGRTTGYLNTLPVGGCGFNGAASTGGVNWWAYTAAVTEDVTVSTCGLSLFNTRLSVYTQSPDCNNLQCLGLNDDTPGCPGGSSELVFPATAGQTYLIAVHGSGAATGNYQLSATCAPPCAPATGNDRCGSAQLLTPVINDGTGVPTLGDNTCAYVEQGTSCSGAGPVAGVWYTFNSGPNEHLTITLLGENQFAGTADDLSYALFSGSCTSVLATGEIACATSGEGYDQVLPMLTTFTEYKLLVYNTGGIGTAGTFAVMLEFPASDDAGISEVVEPVGLICSSEIVGKVELTNYGANPLTSVDILYNLDNDPQQVYTWVGLVPLAYNQSILVQLPAISNVSQTTHTYEATVANPNGQPDGIAENDTSSSSFTSSGEAVTLRITQDRFGSEITWEIYDALEIAPIATGGPYADLPANGTQVHLSTHCLPLDFGNCFTLRLIDSFGDGLCCLYGSGGWEILSTNGDLLLSDVFQGSGTLAGSSDNGGSNSPSGSNPAYTGHEFCLPKGPADIEAADCGVFNNTLHSKVYADQAPGTGNYQFEFSDPDFGFRRRISVVQRYVKFSQMQTSPLVAGTHYFARARRDAANDGFFNDNWGSGCDMALDPTAVPGCGQLIDDVGSPTHSCGVVRSFGYSDKVWAQPVLGALQYRFRFTGALDPDGPSGPLTPAPGTRVLTQPSYVRVLNWGQYTLIDGETYSVAVEVFVNGVWSGLCGPVCQVTIDNPPAFGGRTVQESTTASDIQLYPNPVRDGKVNLVLNGLTGQEGSVVIDVYDLFGQRVQTRVIATEGAIQLSAVLDLGSNLSSGLYMVDITMGDRHDVQRLTVQ